MVSSQIVPTRFKNAVEASSQILTHEPTNDMRLLSEIVQGAFAIPIEIIEICTLWFKQNW